jgi:arylsulfatase A-like enzyme
MLAVDEMIGSLVSELREAGELDDTYIVFTSDNGFHMGEHRLGPGKWTPYEEDISVPLVVRGPGVPAGRRLGHMVLNNDLAPTFADLAQVEAPTFVDGRSLAPLLAENPPSPQDWRQSFMVEGAFETAGDLESPQSLLTGDRPPEDWRWQIVLAGVEASRYWGRPAFEALRTRDHLYVEYETGGRELYNLRRDPYQLNNKYPNADPRLLQSLEKHLDTLRDCHGSFCKTAENGADDMESG